MCALFLQSNAAGGGGAPSEGRRILRLVDDVMRELNGYLVRARASAPAPVPVYL
jgi:hypothetical protein